MSDTTSEETDSYSEEQIKPLPKKDYPKGYNLQQAIKNTQERMVPECPLPTGYVPTDEEFWLGERMPNADFIKKHLIAEGSRPSEFYYSLIQESS